MDSFSREKGLLFRIKSFIFAAGERAVQPFYGKFCSFERKIVSRFEGFLAAARKKVVLVAALCAGSLLLVLAGGMISATHGLRGRYFDNPSWKGSPVSTSIDSLVHFEGEEMGIRAGETDRFGILWDGYLFAPKTSTYRLSISSDDGSWVYLDDDLVMDNGEARQDVPLQKEISLSRGNHRLFIKYFNESGKGRIDFQWKETKTPRAFMPRLHLYFKPVSLGFFALDTVMFYLGRVFKAAFLALGLLLLVMTVMAVFPRWKLLSALVFSLFLVVAGVYEGKVFSRKSTSVVGCDNYSYLQGAELMARHGLFRTEYFDPLVPRIYQSLTTKPPDDKLIFLLSPHGHYVYDLQKGAVYNVFPPGTSLLLYPFVKLGGRAPAFFALPFLNLILLLLLFFFGSKHVNIIFGICLAAWTMFNVHIFENTVFIMSDIPSMALLCLSAFFLYRNLKAPRRWLPFVAGACFGFDVAVRYSNLMGALPLAVLVWLRIKSDRRVRETAKDLLSLAAGAFLFGVLPLALYTNHLFGTVFRLVYEPITQSRAEWVNLAPGVSYYLTSMLGAFGVLGVVLMIFGFGACLARPQYRTAGLVCLLAFLSFFLFYAFQSLRNERYLLPAYPFLAVLVGFGVLEIARWFGRSLILRFLLVGLCAAYPFLRSNASFPFGTTDGEAISKAVAKHVPPNAVVFCDQWSGSLRFYAKLPGYRFLWTDNSTLKETLLRLSENYPLYFFLDNQQAKNQFLYLNGQGTIPAESVDLVSIIRGWPLYRFRATAETGR